MRRCKEFGIGREAWRLTRHIHAPVVMMIVELAVSEEGRAYLTQLHYADQLDRIVIEECQSILTASEYRLLMAQLALLRSIPMRFVYIFIRLSVTRAMSDTIWLASWKCKHFPSDATARPRPPP